MLHILMILSVIVLGLIVALNYYKYKAEYYRQEADLWELKFEILSDRIKEI